MNARLKQWSICGLLLCFAASVDAQTNSWTNSASGKWETAANWSLGIRPAATQAVFLTNGNTKTVTVDQTTFATAPASMTVTSLTLSAPDGQTNTLSRPLFVSPVPLRILNGLEIGNGGWLSAYYPGVIVDQLGGIGISPTGLVIGASSAGSMRMNGGAVSPYSLTVGLHAGSSGTLSMMGGTNQLGDLFVGYTPGASGAVWIVGDALVSSRYVIMGGPTPGAFGLPAGGVGQITISNGAMAADSMWVGGYAPNSPGSCGTLTIAGGTLALGGPLWNGYSGYANGTVWLTSGQLIVTNSGAVYGGVPGYPSIWTGAGLGGQITVSNGLLLANSLWVFNRLTLAGGVVALSSNFSQAVGITTVTGGELDVTNSAETASLLVVNGSLTLSNGSITADLLRMPYAGASLNILGGTLTVRGSVVANGKQFAVGSTNGPTTGTFVLNGGFHSFSNGLFIAPNALLTGCGTIIGAVTNQGTIALTCSSVFSNDVVNAATLIVSNGVIVDFYGPVVNNGIIDAIAGTVNFHSTFENNGLYLDADGDADGDGLSNLQESLAGTSPTNSASTFHVFSITPTGDDMLVSWQAGGGRTNVVEARADLAGSYTNLSDNIILPGTGDVTTNYLDVGGATNVPARFYRIRLVP